MLSRDFCFWLQGLFEGNPGLISLSVEQTEIIKQHLALAFVHDIDPSMGDKKHQTVLDAIHHGIKPAIDPGKTVMRC